MKPSKLRERAKTKAAVVRKAELMNAAEVLFLNQGVEPTTIEQITTAAGVAKGSFYRHFRDKEGLVLALSERFDSRLVSRASALIARRPAEDWKAKLEDWIEAAVDAHLASLPLHRLVFHKLPLHGRRGTRSSIVADHLAGILSAGAREGAWTVESPALIAVLLTSGLHSIVDSVLDRDVAIDRSRIVASFRDLCFLTVGIR